MAPLYVLRCGGRASASWLCVILLTACASPATPEQLTVVEGTVTSAANGRPLPGVLLAVESFARRFFGPMTFTTTGDSVTGDSVRTNAQGGYRLPFYIGLTQLD